MKEEALQKINKMGKVGYILTKICKIFIIIGIVCLVVAGCIVAALPKGFVQITTSEHTVTAVEMKTIGQTVTPQMLQNLQSDDNVVSISINGVEVEGANMTVEDEVITVDQTSEDSTYDIHSSFWKFFVAAIMLGFVLASFIFANKLCKAVETCSTPFEENVIKAMKYFAYSLIPWVFNENFDLELFNKDFSVVGINLTMVIVVLAVLALTYIFQYGAMLQQESDETL